MLKNYWLTPEHSLIKVKEHYSFLKHFYNNKEKEEVFDEVSKAGYVRIVVCEKNKEMLICYNKNIDLNPKKLKVLKDYCIEHGLILLKERYTDGIDTGSIIQISF